MHVSQTIPALAGSDPRRGQFSRYLLAFSPLGLVRALLDYRRRQREYRDLLELPDYLLQDVGLTRPQIIAGAKRDHL